MTGEIDTRVIDLETRVAFQEETIQQLNEALVKQQADVDRLQLALTRLTEQVERMEPPEIGQENEPPPHY